MADKLVIKWPALVGLLKDPGVVAEVHRVTRNIDRAAQAHNTETRVDFSETRKRTRGAVIAGYEDNATAENTRRALLSALDGANG